MSAPPYFPFYVDDFLASPKVRRMDAEQVGIYLLLLCEQWQRQGPLPEGVETELAPIMRTQCERITGVLETCFKKGPKGWENVRLRMMQRDVEAKSAKARRAAKVRWDKGSNANALQTHSERNANGMQYQNQNQNQTDKTHTVDAVAPTTDFPVKPKKDGSGHYQYPAPFEQAWSEYPARDGSNPKVGAYKAFRARVVTGAEPEQLATAARHYRLYCQSREIEGTSFVQQAATFYGPSEPWQEFVDPPSSNGNGKPLTPVRFY